MFIYNEICSYVRGEIIGNYVRSNFVPYAKNHVNDISQPDALINYSIIFTELTSKGEKVTHTHTPVTSIAVNRAKGTFKGGYMMPKILL